MTSQNDRRHRQIAKHILRGRRLVGQWMRTTADGEVETFIARQEQRGSFGRSTFLTGSFSRIPNF